MKKSLLFIGALALIVLSSLGAQSTSSGSANGMTFNGATGLIIVPDARIGWGNSKFGLDIGYGFVWTGDQDMDHLPRFSMSIAQVVEIHGLFHFGNDSHADFKNMVLGAKFKLVEKGGSALALGGDIEFDNRAPDGGNDQVSSKIYLAATYGGKFFNAPAVTTATIGWQMFEAGNFAFQFVYGMGFSMSLFPQTFDNHVFWITDFGNFSYAVYRPNINAGNRGAFNTGIRIRPFKKGRFKMVIDLLGTDLLDAGQRGLGLNISGGMAL